MIPIIAAIIACTVFYVAARFQANRAANLQVQAEYLTDRVANLVARLDDAERELGRLQITNGYLIAESTTLVDDLVRSEAHSNYLAACLRKRRGTSAGWLLLAGLCREGRRMRVLDGGVGLQSAEDAIQDARRDASNAEKNRPQPADPDPRLATAQTLRNWLAFVRDMAAEHYAELTGSETDLLPFERSVAVMLPKLDSLIAILDGKGEA